MYLFLIFCLFQTLRQYFIAMLIALCCPCENIIGVSQRTAWSKEARLKYIVILRVAFAMAFGRHIGK